MEKNSANAFEYRLANDGDANGIFAIVEEVASEIPVSLDTPERKEMMQAIIAECCATEESWVTLDGSGTVVGFVLAKPDKLERFLHKNQALTLPYIGVKKLERQRGIFAALMEKQMAKGVPLTATVLHANQSGMANRLVKIGFCAVESDDKQTHFNWNL